PPGARHGAGGRLRVGHLATGAQEENLGARGEAVCLVPQTRGDRCPTGRRVAPHVSRAGRRRSFRHDRKATVALRVPSAGGSRGSISFQRRHPAFLRTSRRSVLIPKIVTSLSTYDRTQLSHDVLAGVVVGIVALPLAIAFAIASGLSPERGLW